LILAVKLGLEVFDVLDELGHFCGSAVRLFLNDFVHASLSPNVLRLLAEKQRAHCFLIVGVEL